MLPVQVLVLTLVLALLLAAPAARGAREQGDAMEVGELVAVRLNVTGGGRAAVGFMLCDANTCNKVELWGVAPSKMRALLYKNFVGCNRDGWQGREVGHNIAGDSDKTFPASTVLIVTRVSERLLTVLLHGDKAGPSSTSVPLAAAMDKLYVKNHYMSEFAPDNVTVEFLVGAWRRRCENGGAPRPQDNACECAHGFDGPSCETACGPNRYGPGCSERCAAGGRGCRGLLFQSPGDGERVCGAGLRGDLCDQVCGPGSYGPGCLLTCGQCAPGPCDPYTGQCPAGCRPGYHGAACTRALTHLTVAPDMVNVSESSLSGTFAPTKENTAGSGRVAFYDVQYREVRAEGGSSWVTGVLVRRLAPSAEPRAFVVDGLRPGVEYDVRVVLLDDELRGYEAVPQVRVATAGTRRVSGLSVHDVTPRSATISWRSPADTEVLVLYECVKSLVCSENCSHMSGMLVGGGHENRTTRRVQGLLPGAVYRVRVSPKDAAVEQGESTTFTTAFAAPDAVPEAAAEEGGEAADKSAVGSGLSAGPGVVSVTNTTATFRWRMPQSCTGLNGVVSGTRWQLLLRATDCPSGCPTAELPSVGVTTSTSLTLQPLQPNTAYELRLWVLNTEGYNPGQYLSVRFTTTLASGPQRRLN